jgi:hypothetical protein
MFYYNNHNQIKQVFKNLTVNNKTQNYIKQEQIYLSIKN